MLILTIVGARPQFIKAAPVSRALAAAGIREVIIDTEQHYDDRMRRIFFEELGLLEPTYCLNVGSGTHAEQTASGLIGIERAICEVRPDWVLVYGDTNATLSGALAASKLYHRVAHVEAGLRSYNRMMPEEINRVLVDHMSDCLLCPSETAAANLASEGIHKGVFIVGDVMVDSLWWARTRPRPSTLKLPESPYAVATIHRPANTDDPTRLQSALECLRLVEIPVVFPVHPRTRFQERRVPSNVLLYEPFSFVEMVHTVMGAEIIITDSGGLQKEAYLLGKPILTLREETEWVETLEGGWNRLVGTDPERVRKALRQPRLGQPRPDIYGDGHAGERVAQILQTFA